MDIIRAKEILECLADGVNPLTGEVLPPDDSCNQGDVVRALYTVLASIPENMASPDASEKPKKPQPEKAGKPWSEEDNKMLAQMFDEGRSRKEMCEYFERSTGGIAARLVRIGKIANRDEFRKRN